MFYSGCTLTNLPATDLKLSQLPPSGFIMIDSQDSKLSAG